MYFTFLPLQTMLTRHNLTIIEFYILLHPRILLHHILAKLAADPETTSKAPALSSSSSSSSGIGSMAATCLSSPHILAHNSGPVIKPVSRILMLQQNGSHAPPRKAPALSVRSSLKAKVFENRAEGIVCYRDESGEIICEGFDEGPRFHQQLQGSSYHPRDAEIINLLQQRLLQVVNGGGFSNTENGVIVVQEDSNWNGFNKFY